MAKTTRRINDDIRRMRFAIGRLIRELEPGGQFITESGEVRAQVKPREVIDDDALFAAVGADFERIMKEPPALRLAALATEVETHVVSTTQQSVLSVPAQTASTWATILRETSSVLIGDAPGSRHIDVAAHDRTRFAEQHGRSIHDVERSAFGPGAGLDDESREAFVTLVAWDLRYLHVASARRLLREAQVSDDAALLEMVAHALTQNERHRDLGPTKQRPRKQAFMIRLLKRLTYGGVCSFDNREYADLVYRRLGRIFQRHHVTDRNLLAVIDLNDSTRKAYFMDKFLPLRGFRHPRKSTKD